MDKKTDTAVVTLTLPELEAIRAALGSCDVLGGGECGVRDDPICRLRCQCL